MMESKSITDNNLFFKEIESLLVEGNNVTIKVKGNSMLPFIVNERDSVILKKTENYLVGDIVLAKIFGLEKGRKKRSADNYVLHRIRKISGDIVTLEGDGNLGMEEYCYRDKIIAKVETIIYNGKNKNPDSFCHKIKYRLWISIKFLRRYFLGVYRRLPWLKKYTFYVDNN